ncbi:hypothetical protein [Azospirillum halopraeferens]|uniref:hypothetical protein n=1 Tax=Azospirillum halopraeferens TaxID=34010 RepID=UPI000414185D|nr:hypothetical protein [Azospirillum halopraeferens]
MPEALTRAEFETVWKAFLKQAAGDFVTRRESDVLRDVIGSQTDALQSMIAAVNHLRGEIEALHAGQSALRAQIAALSMVGGTLARGLVAAGVPEAEVRRAVEEACAALPEDVRRDGAPAIGAVLAVVPGG